MTSLTTLAARRAAALALALTPALGHSAAAQRRAERAPAPNATAADAAAPSAADSAMFRGLVWRNVGPFRGGRATAVTGVPGQPLTFYMGATGGGVWKTEDGGSNWRNVSDGFFRMGSVGAIAVAPSDANVVYVGMGEAPVRGVSSSYGDGVYKSTDAGRTWTHVGLEPTRQISRIQVHPTNPELLYVAAQGTRWTGSAERGIYRSADGGKTWALVLKGATPTAGASDLAMDPTNPRVLYAAFWDHQRTPWQVRSGGPGSGVWKTADGGDTWTRLREGLPRLMGKVGVSVSAANPDRVYAIVEADSGGLFRSDDAGKTWRLVNGERGIRARAWYYTAVTADPKNADVVYAINATIYKSIDGGRTMVPFPDPHGDNHALWIDPTNSAAMINANDGGANISFNGGRTWSTQRNQPTAQFYRVNTDDRLFYYLYGGQQDNTSVAIASRTEGFGITESDWFPVSGCESARPAFDPADPRYIYGNCYQGIIGEYDRETKIERNVMPYLASGLAEPSNEQKYRFNWSAPVITSPHDRKVIYFGGNVLFKSADRGRTWSAISPDLTRNDKAKQGPGGSPITNEGAGGEVYNTLYEIAESPLEAGVIWVGTDDGLVQLTRDGGKAWTNVTPPGVGEALTYTIEPSHFDKGTAYVVITRYKWNDNAPYLFRTTDYGKTWTKLTAGIAADDPLRTVREDPERRGLLVAGSETGIYLSVDGGARWRRMPAKFPPVPVTDLQFRHGDLVAATEGRAFWVLDDVSPLRQWADSAQLLQRAGTYLFAPRKTYRLGGADPDVPNVGKNAPGGAIIYYALDRDYGPQKPDTGALVVVGDTAIRRRFGADSAPSAANAGAPDATLEIVDATGAVVRSWTTKPTPPAGPFVPPAVPLPGKQGLNRFVWDLRNEHGTMVPGVMATGPVGSYRVPPGSYTVRLTAGGKTLTRPLELLLDPRSTMTADELRAQQDMLRDITARVSEINESVIALRAVRDQVNALAGRLKERPEGDTVAKLGAAIATRVGAEEGQLVQPKMSTFQDVINFRNGLADQYIFLAGAVDATDDPPTAAARERLAELDARWAERRRAVDAILTQQVPAFNALVRSKDVPAVIVPAGKKAAVRGVVP